MSDLIFSGIGVLLFVVLFIPILMAVRQIPAFNGNNAVVLAICITLLCIIGIYQFLVVPLSSESTNTDKRGIVFILIPYAALALAILIALLVRFLRKQTSGGNRWKSKWYGDGMHSDTHIPKKFLKQNSNLRKEK